MNVSGTLRPGADAQTATYKGPLYGNGVRKDGLDLTEKWLSDKQDAWLVWNKAGLAAVNENATDYLMGLFEPQDTANELSWNRETNPSIVEMVDKAIRTLRRNPRGFFLFVEGGRTDHRHHNSKVKQAVVEAVMMGLAVEQASRLTSASDTLSVVTADHSHIFTFGGNTPQGSSLIGLAPKKATDKASYTSILYGKGPSCSLEDWHHLDASSEAFEDKDYRQQTVLPLSSETHSGEEVAILAQGPMAHLFHGRQEQSYIAHVMAFARCIQLYHEGWVICWVTVPAAPLSLGLPRSLS
ncbi:intestinal-type alkaline phosphatase-like [Candoia aspera]|uniref:intestinal-type alkaline phosphatase-like n=1 Tax=Candoia aspera TaxID=51853 RepID=UPI002FD86EA6